MDLKGLITEDGYSLIKKKLEDLVYERKEVLKNMVDARVIPGDDNPELIYSQAELLEKDKNISKLEEILVTSLVMQTNSVDSVGFGSNVTYVDDSGKEYIGRIVGTNEIIYMNDAISALSPMADAMFGLAEGDEFDVMVGNNISTYTIVKVSL